MGEISTSDLNFDTFPVSPKGHKFEDFVPGRRFVHHWGRTITAGDNALFSTGTCNWNPMHLNAEFARGHGHKDVVVNPMLVLCVAVGLSVEDLSEGGGPFLGMANVSFHVPVYPGDTITVSSTVVSAVPSRSRSDSGIVTWSTEARNQHDEVVLSYERTNISLKRSEQR